MQGQWSLRCVLCYLVLGALATAQAYRWPSPQYDAVEALLYEGSRADRSSMASLVHPCKLRPRTKASIAAEWLRFAYHDVATHNISDGTGGLDGSLAYELDRAENVGDGMKDALSDFRFYSHKYISRSDVIAVGATFAVASCGGPIIPYRSGRIDALGPGPSGVPQPHQDLPTHTDIFQRQGFNPSEMITLVACGHTLGGVRSLDFPTLVAPGSDPSIPNFKLFDSTPEFDNTMIVQYLNGSTKNPLVVDSNTTLTSDSRIFSSDGNQTMQSLASSSAFSQTCANLLERMVNTVPQSVVLTEEVTLLPVKVLDVGLTIEHRILVFKATLRLTKQFGVAANKQRLVKMFWCDRYGQDRDCGQTVKFAQPAAVNQDDHAVSPVTSRVGLSFVKYNFVVPVDPSLSLSKFWFQVDEKNGSEPITYDNGGDGYSLEQDNIIFVPSLSGSSLLQDGNNYTLIAAVRASLAPARVFVSVFDNAMSDNLPPLNTTLDMALDSSLVPTDGYTFYSAVVEDPSGHQLTADFHCEVDGVTYTEDFQPTFFLQNSPTSSPSDVGVISSNSTITPGSSKSSSTTIRHRLLRSLDLWTWTFVSYILIYVLL
ncbi:heme peroxidase [Pluteus cervinus]|uniref:Heme peroxidase n=1 Tax=Pluteus cervinus TaxID=181527 RepID=A0ACD3BE80_9AGAR|nr:heme peroxidase [Pluteus cervinus]